MYDGISKDEMKYLLYMAVVDTISINSLKESNEKIINTITRLQNDIKKTLSMLPDDRGTVIKMKDGTTYLCKRSGIEIVDDLGVSNHDRNGTNNV